MTEKTPGQEETTAVFLLVSSIFSITLYMSILLSTLCCCPLCCAFFFSTGLWLSSWFLLKARLALFHLILSCRVSCSSFSTLQKETGPEEGVTLSTTTKQRIIPVIIPSSYQHHLFYLIFSFFSVSHTQDIFHLQWPPMCLHTDNIQTGLLPLDTVIHTAFFPARCGLFFSFPSLLLSYACLTSSHKTDWTDWLEADRETNRE